MTALPDETPLLPGTRLAHYVVGRRIGSGAMGTVYEADDTALDRAVALKVVNPELAEDREMSQRFVLEARAAARANSPNLTHIYYVGSADGRPFYAMEFVPGENLEDRVRRTGPLPLTEALDVLAQAARGLRAAHDVGVVHRDVKPSNLILLPDGQVKVTDFGLAKSLGADPGATQVGQLLGTPTYMSPEQCRGAAVDARTDIYALGLTAWFLLAGRPAYDGTSLGEVLNGQMNEPVPPLTTVRPDLPPSVDALLGRLCAKAPSRRPESMEEVRRLLEAVRPCVVRPSPFATRAAAFGVDILLLLIAAATLSFVGELAERRLGPSPIIDWGALALMAAVAFFLHWGLEARYATSPGKRLFGLSVMRPDGSHPSRKALLLRFLLRFVPLAMVARHSGEDVGGNVGFSFGILPSAVLMIEALVWPFAGRRTLSDILTRTRVVYREPDASETSPALG